MARRSDYVSDVELKQCMLTSALLVDRYGDEMLPILERFEAEYAKAKQRRDAPKQVDRIRALIAKDHAGQLEGA